MTNQSKDRIAISEHQALKVLYYAGNNTEPLLKEAQKQLYAVKPATVGYWYADDVDNLVKRLGNNSV